MAQLDSGLMDFYGWMLNGEPFETFLNINGTSVNMPESNHFDLMGQLSDLRNSSRGNNIRLRVLNINRKLAYDFVINGRKSGVVYKKVTNPIGRDGSLVW